MNLKQLVYGKSTSLATSSKEVQDSSEDEETDDDFFKPKGEGNKVRSDVICVIISLIVSLSLMSFSINNNFRYVSFNMTYKFDGNLMQFCCVLSNSCSFIAEVKRRNG